MATKSTRYGFNGGYQAQYSNSNADYTANETEKNVKAGKSAVRALALAGLVLLSVVMSGCNNVKKDSACDLTGKNTAVTTCLYGALTGK